MVPVDYALRDCSVARLHVIGMGISLELSILMTRARARLSGLAHPDSRVISSKLASPLRHVGQRYWYDVVADAGLQYGASFRGLDEISTSATYLSAVASISITENVNHTLHPVTMDQCFQILMVAAHQGQGRKLTKLFVPTSIQELMVHGGALDGMRKLSIGGKVTQVGENGMMGDTSIMTQDGHLILSMQDCRASVVSFRKRKAETKLALNRQLSCKMNVSHCILAAT